MILSLSIGAFFSLLLFLPTFFTIRNRGLNCRYLKKMKFKTFSCKKKKKLFLLDENSLQSQPLFWTVIALPLAVGVMLWAAVAHEYELEWSTSAYSRLMINAQFPFVILALSPILGAFVMYGHRSLQTFTQINATNKQIDTASKQLETARKQFEEVQKKNKVDIYLAKRKFIKEELSVISTKNNEKISKVNSLYLALFFVEDNYKDVINHNYFDSINNILIKLHDKLNILFKETPSEVLSDFYKEIIDIPTDNPAVNNLLGDMINSINKSILNVSLDNEALKNKLYIESSFTIELYYKKFREHYKNDEATRRTVEVFQKENKDLFLRSYFIKQVCDEVISTLDVVREILLIALDDKKIFDTLPAFESLYTIATEGRNMKYNDNFIGDKLAAENQNPPE